LKRARNLLLLEYRVQRGNNKILTLERTLPMLPYVGKLNRSPLHRQARTICSFTT